MISAMDITSDVGEGYGNYSFGADAAVMPYLSSANVACGFHAGDPVIMERTVNLAKQHGVAVGVHWGLPDVVGFGRRRMDISGDDARCLTLYQIGALTAFVDAAGVEIDHIAPHGALYAMLSDREDLAREVVRALKAIGKQWVIYAGSPLERHQFYDMAKAEGFRLVHLLAADLEYRGDGGLIIERVKRRVDPTEVSERVKRFVETRTVRAVDGTDLKFDAQSVLVHGDGPNALDVVKAVRNTLDGLGVRVERASRL